MTRWEAVKSACVACPRGTAKPGPGPAPCLPCDPGSFASAVAASACEACPPGAAAARSGSASCGCGPGYESALPLPPISSDAPVRGGCGAGALRGDWAELGAEHGDRAE